jgi:hypothetical protein
MICSSFFLVIFFIVMEIFEHDSHKLSFETAVCGFLFLYFWRGRYGYVRQHILMTTPLKICVFGSSAAATPESYLEASRELARLLAAGDHTCINGGGRLGRALHFLYFVSLKKKKQTTD